MSEEEQAAYDLMVKTALEVSDTAAVLEQAKLDVKLAKDRLNEAEDDNTTAMRNEYNALTAWRKLIEANNR